MIKKTLLTAVVIGILSGGLIVASQTFAQESSAGQHPEISLVQKLADRFDLNANEVQAVFDEHREEMQEKRETQYISYLDDLVETGAITEKQKLLLLDKHKQLISQMHDNKEAFKGMAPSERKVEMQETKRELKAWAEQNNIDPKYLHPLLHLFILKQY